MDKLIDSNPRASAEANSVPPAPAAAITPVSASDPAGQPEAEQELLGNRLGPAVGLFSALRYRHPPTAAHSLRVTLGCASWALALDMSPDQRDLIESAALLHDIGKLSVPDGILLKPTGLDATEQAQMLAHRLRGVDLLRCCGAEPAVLELVQYAPAWFDGNRPGFDRQGDALPLGARMLSIADAFDAMTSDAVYRPAWPRERATAELARAAGTQFDPALVRSFLEFNQYDPSALHEQVVERWLRSAPASAALGPAPLALAPSDGLPGLFRQTALDNLRDAVVFLNARLEITLWNAGAERMTGLAAGQALQTTLRPSVLDMRDEEGFTLPDDRCPVAEAVQSGAQSLRRLTIRGRHGRDVSVECHVVPVIDDAGTTHGAALVMHDVSPELSLEARCQRLHEMATKDPLTRVANRAEFNRVHAMFVDAHLERQLPCSLVVADLDHFKKINDTYGHPAGDEVLTSFARLLKGVCRPGDLAARYGGEEFVVLCADCDQSAAVRRAEEMRRRISQMAHTALDMNRVTASFGVTEIQQGDTPETMFARADRALYLAKERGRNQVVHLGSGLGTGRDGAAGEVVAGGAGRDHALLEQELVASVPMSVAIEKLRGFVADQQADIVSIDEGQVRLRLGGGWGSFFRRASDRRVPMVVDLQFIEEKPDQAQAGMRLPIRTRILVALRTQRNRDRRRQGARDRAQQVLASLRAYLMASDAIDALTSAETTAAPAPALPPAAAPA
jgi:diguanylate cyclase (GGDEF)-like protein